MNLAEGKVYMSGKTSSEVSVLQKKRYFWPAVNFLLLSVICTLADPIFISSIFVFCFYVAISPHGMNSSHDVNAVNRTFIFSSMSAHIMEYVHSGQ